MGRKLTTSAAGEHAGVTSRTIRLWIEQGLPYSETAGGHYRVDVDDLDRWLARKRRERAQSREGVASHQGIKDEF